MDEERRARRERTGVFTSGIVSTKKGRKVALFFTGPKHAGENLADVLKIRAAELDTPIQMCDALTRNLPGELKVIVSNCIAHSRRKFVDVLESFPTECRHVLEELGKVYKIDAEARAEALSAEARLALHKRESGPIMEKLHAWLQGQLEEKKVKPNSGPRAGDRLRDRALGEADPLPGGAGSAAGQQCLRARIEEGDPPPKGEPLFQDAKRCASRRRLHEPHLHLPASGRRSFRVPQRAPAPCRRGGGEARGLDALELQADPRPDRSRGPERAAGACAITTPARTDST